MNILGYDKYLVTFSGGKDSTAAFLALLEAGVDRSKIEIWHHLVDGPGSTLFDWEVTESYCKAFAAAFGVPIYFQWKEGGFKREMLREDSLTAPTTFECPDGTRKTVGGTVGKKSTRRKFPQITASLMTRWCSAYLKIDVCSAAIRNQARFNGIRTLVISGERAQEAFTGPKGAEKFAQFMCGQVEGKGRASYKDFEPHRSDNRDGRSKRHVDHWRPVLMHDEKQVWAAMEKWKVRAHPAYFLGFSRCSCKFCIFGNGDQFATAARISPALFGDLVGYEEDFGHTMKRNISLTDLVKGGEVYESFTKEMALVATSYNYRETIFMDEWQLPSGAYGDGCGPT